uniref:(northern house mosquito) hypothetical protein n=1 Tax=Culex pipiens TaxID=7175 RepID=A0A8D8BK23_CULPI
MNRKICVISIASTVCFTFIFSFRISQLWDWFLFSFALYCFIFLLFHQHFSQWYLSPKVVLVYSCLTRYPFFQWLFCSLEKIIYTRIFQKTTYALTQDYFVRIPVTRERERER